MARKLVSLMLCVALLCLVSGCSQPAEEGGTGLPSEEELAKAESAIGYDLDTTLKALGLSEEDITAMDANFPGVYDVNEPREIDGLEYQERIYINSTTNGFITFDFTYIAEDGEGFTEHVKSLYAQLEKAYGEPVEDTGLARTGEWERFENGVEDSWETMWDGIGGGETRLQMSVTNSQETCGMILMYSAPYLYEERMAESGGNSSSPAP